MLSVYLNVWVILVLVLTNSQLVVNPINYEASGGACVHAYRQAGGQT